MVKNLPANAGDVGVQSLGQEDPLEEGMATYSNILGWRIPWTEEPGRLQFMGSKELDTTEAAEHTHDVCTVPSLEHVKCFSSGCFLLDHTLWPL